MWRQFSKTKAFEQTIEFFYLNENIVFICSHPLSPNNAAKRFVVVNLFPTLKKGEREATFHDGKGQNLHQGKRWAISCVSTTFVHDCSYTRSPSDMLLAKRLHYGGIGYIHTYTHNLISVYAF